jgi:hypothetical protein
MRAKSALVSATVIAVLSGCGGSDETAVVTHTTAEPLTAAEIAAVQELQQTVQGYCAEVRRYLAGERGPPTPFEFGEAAHAIDEFAALAREKPGATIPSGVDLRLALGDLAEGLEGSNCSDELVRRIDEALATTPSSP